MAAKPLYSNITGLGQVVVKPSLKKVSKVLISLTFLDVFLDV